MVKTIINKQEMYMDGYLKSNLDLLKQAVAKKWDGVGYVCGYEGDGKSVLASQIAYYLDPTYNLDRCVFTVQQFEKALDEAEKGQVIVFDEAYNTFSNNNRHDKFNKMIVSKLTMIRKKQLFILIVAPTFFDMNKYLVIHRSRFMIHVYSEELERGRFRFFNREGKHKLFIYGKKFENMYATKPAFIGRFTSFFPLPEKEYDIKKDEAIKAITKALKTKKYKNLTKAQIELAQNKLVLWMRNRKLLAKDYLSVLAEEFFLIKRDTYRKRLVAARDKVLDYKDGVAEEDD